MHGVLLMLGFEQVQRALTAEDELALVLTREIALVLVERAMAPIDGIAFVRCAVANYPRALAPCLGATRSGSVWHL